MNHNTMKRFKQYVMIGFLFCTTILTAVNAKSLVTHPNNQDLPPLILADLNTRQHDLDEWSGKVIILNFWATWCRPCQIEIPHLIEYQSAYAGSGLQIIGVGLDEQRKLENYVRTVGINYPVLCADPQQHRHLLQDWGDKMGVLPYTVVINKQGQLVYSQVGLFSDDTFNTYVKPLLIKDSELSTAADNSP